MINNSGHRLRSKLSTIYRRCRCYTCLAHPDHAVLLKRPATSAAKLSLNWTATTLFYSTVIGTGALLDARHKQNRRRSLDGAILQAEQELADGQKRQASRLAALGLDAEDVDTSQPALVSGGLAERPRDFQGDCLDRSHAAPRSAEPFNSVEKMSDLAWQMLDADFEGIPSWPAPLNSPSSLYADRDVQTLRTQYTPKKLIRTEYSIARLALQLKLHVCHLPGPEWNEETRDRIEARLSQLSRQLKVAALEDPLEVTRVTRLPFPQYTPEIDQAAQIEQQLNLAISRLFDKYDRREISLRALVEKLTYNLLISPVPPSKVAYTNMVKQFSRVREFGMAGCVIESMRESTIRHDELSISTILMHYLRKNDRRGFIRFHETMCGKHGALMLAKSPPKGYETLPWWTSPISSSDKYMTKIVWDPCIWQILLWGYLSFGELNEATRLTLEMAQAGLAPDLRVYKKVMEQSLAAKDYSRALDMWDKIEKCHPLARRDGRVEYGSPEHHCIRTALRACMLSGMSFKFKEIYRGALERGLRMHSLLVESLPRPMNPSGSYLAYLRRCVNVLDHKVNLLEGELAQVWQDVHASERLFGKRTPTDAGNATEPQRLPAADTPREGGETARKYRLRTARSKRLRELSRLYANAAIDDSSSEETLLIVPSK